VELVFRLCPGRAKSRTSPARGAPDLLPHAAQLAIVASNLSVRRFSVPSADISLPVYQYEPLISLVVPLVAPRSPNLRGASLHKSPTKRDINDSEAPQYLGISRTIAPLRCSRISQEVFFGPF